MQRRIRETRRDRIAAAVAKPGTVRTLLDRVLRREPGERPLPVELDPDAAVDRGDDIWKSLRF
ncbi:MAG TPA: hypothetical protein VFP41_10585 [Actinomycetota bacterium]|nr:hypothetical protein [Actinomycetota bacterium]